MATNPRNFAKENYERATEAASSGANWMAQLADYNLRQSMAALDGMLTMVRHAADGVGHHASAMRENAVQVAEKAVENTTEFANRMVRLKDPLEWAQVQSEYMSKQARTFADGNRKLSEALMREAGEVMDEARRASSQAAE